MNRPLFRTIVVYILFSVFFTLTCPSLGADDSNTPPMIVDIGFLKGQFENAPPLPGNLKLDLYTTGRVDFKLLYNDLFVNSGTLFKGDNQISVPSDKLFGASGEYVFHLETRNSRYHFKYEITITVDLKTPVQQPDSVSNFTNPAAILSSPEPIRYSLEMYIKGHLAAKNRKKIFSGIPNSQLEAIQRALKTAPGNPLYGNNPGDPQTAGSGGGGLDLIRTFITVSKLLKKKKRPPKERSISVSYRKKNSNGAFQTHRANLSLLSRIVK